MDRERDRHVSHVCGGDLMFGPARVMLIGSGFNPDAYAGLVGDWLADDSVVSVGNITSIPTGGGTGGDLDALGTVGYLAAGWDDGTPAAEFNNTSARAFSSSAGFGGAGVTTWRSFHVIDPDSIVATAPTQAVSFVGSWADGDLFGAQYLTSFNDGKIYRQNIGYVGDLPVWVAAGPQVWCIERIGTAFEIFVDGVSVLASTTDATASRAITILGFTFDGITPNADSMLNGKWKRTLHYEGAMSAGDRNAISAALVDLYVP